MIRYLFTILVFSSNFFFSMLAQEKKPNIVFIMADDHTSQAWGIYGGVLQDFVKNENIKKIAANGAQLNNVFCTNSICVPSRASIMTGQYSHLNEVYTLSDALETNKEVFTTLLQDAGYQTALFGKWHLKNPPQGFNEYVVLPNQGRYNNPLFKTKDNWTDNPNDMVEKKGFSTDVITDMSLEWLKSRDTQKPFMLMCHYKATHEPFYYASRFDTLYKNTTIPEPPTLHEQGVWDVGRTFVGQQLEILGNRYLNDVDKKYPGEPFLLNNTLSEKEKRSAIYQKFIKDFLRSGAGIDENIGRILDYLELNNLLENTVIIYTSDQGYFLGDHGMFDKRMMLEESLRMPFIISYPKEIPKGSTQDEMILNIDFPSLFLDYAGVKPPKGFQGKSFRALLKNKTDKNWRNAMYYRYWTQQKNRPAHYGIRTKNRKLIFYYGNGMGFPENDTITTPMAWEFYDLEKDPLETRNRYAEPSYQEEIEELKKQLIVLKNEAKDYTGIQ